MSRCRSKVNICDVIYERSLYLKLSLIVHIIKYSSKINYLGCQSSLFLPRMCLIDFVNNYKKVEAIKVFEKIVNVRQI